MTFSTKEFSDAICKFAHKQFADEFAIVIREDGKTNKFRLEVAWVQGVNISTENFLEVPLKGSATETYLALATKFYCNCFTEVLKDMNGEFLDHLKTALLPVHEMTSEAYLAKEVNTEYWEQYLFNVNVELLKVKGKMEEHLLLLSNIRTMRSDYEEFRKLIVRFASENNLPIPLVCEYSL
jgi:hypothetical protein